MRTKKVKLTPIVIIVCLCLLSVKTIDLSTNAIPYHFLSSTENQAGYFSTLKNVLLSQLNIASAQNITDNDAGATTSTDVIEDAVAKQLETEDQKNAEEIQRIFKGYQDYIDLAPSEIKLLYELTIRRQKLDQREQSIEEREATLRALEKRVKESNERLTLVKGEVEKLLSVFDKSFEQERKKLQQIYSNMKPAEAARIFNTLDINTLSLVITGMKPRDAAPILGKMNVEKARAITDEFVESNKKTLAKRLREKVEQEENQENN